MCARVSGSLGDAQPHAALSASLRLTWDMQVCKITFHGKKTCAFILFYLFAFPSVYFDSLSTVGEEAHSQGWPRSSCHKSFPLLPFCGTCAKTAQDKRRFQYVVYFPLVVKEWKFRKEKPLKETITAERAECEQRRQGRFWGAALSGAWNKKAKLGGPCGENSE